MYLDGLYMDYCCNNEIISYSIVWTILPLLILIGNKLLMIYGLKGYIVSMLFK